AIGRIVVEEMRVMAREYLQAAILLRRVVEVDQRRDEVGVGVREIAQVLMPVNDRADLGGFHVEFAMLDAEVRPDQRLDLVEQPRVGAERAKRVVLLKRTVNAAWHALAVDGFGFEFEN